MAISIRNAKEIRALSLSASIVSQALKKARDLARPGISLLELDACVEDCILSLGGRPSFKGLYGFPNAACISLNSVVIHGIPTDYKLQEGDIVGIDVGVEKNGWYGDAAITVGIGKITPQNQNLISASEQVLLDAIEQIRGGMHFKELSALLETLILDYGFVPLQDYCGHGIGKKAHEEPHIPNYLSHGKPKSGEKIRNGMVFCIEPMLCQKSGEAVVLDDGWSVVSKDGLNTSHYEHMVAIIDGRAQILSKE